MGLKSMSPNAGEQVIDPDEARWLQQERPSVQNADPSIPVMRRLEQ